MIRAAKCPIGVQQRKGNSNRTYPLKHLHGILGLCLGLDSSLLFLYLGHGLRLGSFSSSSILLLLLLLCSLTLILSTSSTGL